MQAKHAAHVTLIVALLGALASACARAPSKPALMANSARSEITVYQLRAMDYEYASRFGQIVAAAAHEIAGNTTDASVRERAYRWRMWASPNARASSFDQDPFAGMLELWALAGQQTRYFANGDGRSAFGEQQDTAVVTSRKLEAVIREMAESVVTDGRFDQLAERVDRWVAEHPIEGDMLIRPSARADLASLVPEQQTGGLQAVGSIEETFRDLNDRLTILTVQVPDEARWQAEYLTNALFEERFQKPADSLAAAVEDVTSFLDGFENVLESQTATLLTGIEQERMVIFDTIEAQGGDVLAAIEAERTAILTSIDEQVAAATTKLDQVGRGLIDHFFVRLIEVLAVVGVAVFLLVALVLVVVRRRNRPND